MSSSYFIFIEERRETFVTLRVSSRVLAISDDKIFEPLHGLLPVSDNYKKKIIYHNLRWHTSSTQRGAIPGASANLPMSYRSDDRRVRICWQTSKCCGRRWQRSLLYLQQTHWFLLVHKQRTRFNTRLNIFAANGHEWILTI